MTEVDAYGPWRAVSNWLVLAEVEDLTELQARTHKDGERLRVAIVSGMGPLSEDAPEVQFEVGDLVLFSAAAAYVQALGVFLLPATSVISYSKKLDHKEE